MGDAALPPGAFDVRDIDALFLCQTQGFRADRAVRLDPGARLFSGGSRRALSVFLCSGLGAGGSLGDAALGRLERGNERVDLFLRVTIMPEATMVAS
ncbi:hypothetical protein [uncultured Novosphingobium sp.]|uniref:hypothetical protein n=1 Tax=uncultured Novosphingobium sp. TaxID=292277 RepID=UPI00258714BA|nr:hypothetical protein [uncultured Novosphingobium sp.]